MADATRNVSEYLHQRIERFQPEATVHEVGQVVEAGDGIARVRGLSHVASQELVQFADGTIGIAFNLEAEQVGVIIMGDFHRIEEGMEVRATGRIASVPVGDGLVGRVVNALGEPVDGRGPVAFERFRPIERIAPQVVERQDVDTPLQTGLKAIDSMIPIGRGQRELIIGDRQTGKSAIAIDTIINQKSSGVLCIYVAIGQKKSSVAQTVSTLAQHGAMDHTVVVIAAADEPAVLQYIAPYAGCAIGEDFMESGRDALIIYDDLSKHAWAYRQVSLLLRRPPGREAYPGDVFYLHSRLLERAARLADRHVIVPASFSGEAGEGDAVDGKTYGGPLGRAEAEAARKALGTEADRHKLAKVEGSGGSLTALPIIETLLGDVSAYIPTNIISITDGQIYLESSLFYAGIRPAVNAGISVSRVGGDAQTEAMKQVAARLRLNMAQYRELAAFAQFGSDLDRATQTQLDRGRHLQEILKQSQYEPMPLGHQVAALYAGVNGMIDSIPLDQVHEWEDGLHSFLGATHGPLLETIGREGRMSAENEAELKSAIAAYNASWQ
ncbi:MAG: F0F1 ATP synthase subunit alpha [Anaerolineales bacterium]